MSNPNNPDLVQQILTLIQSHRNTTTNGSSTSSSASNIARSSSSTSINRPVLPSLHQSSSTGRYVPYGRRKKKEPRSYNMNLVVVDFIPEVNDFR